MKRQTRNSKLETRIQESESRNSLRPFVFVNFAMTTDGKTAFANRQFVPFGSERDRGHMMELRAQADAVMSGARTVDSGDVTLGTGGEKYRRMRQRLGLAEYNLRVIVSGSASIEGGATIFKKGRAPIILLTSRSASLTKLRKLRGHVDDIISCGDGELDFPEALRQLRKKWNVKRLLCEGGGELHDALIRAGVVDEIHLTICPKIFGGRTAPTIADGKGFSKLADAAPFELKSMKRIGDELFLVFRRA